MSTLPDGSRGRSYPPLGSDGTRAVLPLRSTDPLGSRRGSAGTCSITVVTGSSSRHTGDSVVNVDHTSTSSLSSSPAGGGGASRGISPVGGSVQRGNGPVSLGPKLRRRSPVLSTESRSRGSSGNSGPPNSAVSGSSSLGRHLSSVIAGSCPWSRPRVVIPRAARLPYGRGR